MKVEKFITKMKGFIMAPASVGKKIVDDEHY
jgi:hypothetical protein